MAVDIEEVSHTAGESSDASSSDDTARCAALRPGSALSPQPHDQRMRLKTWFSLPQRRHEAVMALHGGGSEGGVFGKSTDRGEDGERIDDWKGAGIEADSDL